MRSRYSAYARGQHAYLKRTSAARLRKTVGADKSDPVQWVGLAVLETTDGGPDDTTGTVTFEARFLYQGEERVLREKSQFTREKGRWVYVKALPEEPALPLRPVVLPAAEPGGVAVVGRNDPCPCGSGKKYKKCCGAS